MAQTTIAGVKMLNTELFTHAFSGTATTVTVATNLSEIYDYEIKKEYGSTSPTVVDHVWLQDTVGTSTITAGTDFPVTLNRAGSVGDTELSTAPTAMTGTLNFRLKLIGKT